MIVNLNPSLFSVIFCYGFFLLPLSSIAPSIRSLLEVVRIVSWNLLWAVSLSVYGFWFVKNCLEFCSGFPLLDSSESMS